MNRSANSRRPFESFYDRVRLLSLDVAAAALGAGVMAVRLTDAHLRPAFFILLPAGTWIAYTLDHLLDAHRQGPSAHTPRHRFHAQHAAVLAAACAVIANACAVVGVVELSWTGVGFAVVMATAFLGHEAIVKLAGDRASPWLTKEFGVAVIFTAGTWGLPLLLAWRAGLPIGWSLLLASQYALLALVNLIEFSIFELRIDVRQGQSSFVRAVGRRASARLAAALLVTEIVIAGVVSNFAGGKFVAAEINFVLMAAGLGWILWRPMSFVRHERYRSLGDGVFLMPLLLVLF